ncbi:MAG: hydrogenase formation protein HypD [Bacteroidales bacterium]|nr:hydrogenase formation protein HypD [Bacteroidales bacterium]
MKFVDEFRDKTLVLDLAKEIRKISKKPVVLMEVCGGHTMAIRRFGISSLLPPHITLLSGPGCPVCVTSRGYIDQAVAYARRKDVIIATYGDLVRVPGSTSTLAGERADGADIRVVYSTLDAIEIAKHNPGKLLVFLGIGFETTTPSSAVAIKEAQKSGTGNFYLFSAHKMMPPAMAAIVDEGIRIDGYIGPGHVTTIAGADMYKKLVEKYGLAVVISGFEPVDMMQSIYMLVRQIEMNRPGVEIQYRRAVTAEGNLMARNLINEVFEPRDDWWRGLGILANSGLGIKPAFAQHDAEKQIKVEVEETIEPEGCICGEVLKGIRSPLECRLFGRICTPSSPVGACMVSNEGACQACYRFGG